MRFFHVLLKKSIIDCSEVAIFHGAHANGVFYRVIASIENYYVFLRVSLVD